MCGLGMRLSLNEDWECDWSTFLMSVLPTVQFISQVLHRMNDKNWLVVSSLWLVGRPGANHLITAFQLCVSSHKNWLVVSSPCRSVL